MRWIPRISFTNFKKKYPMCGDCFGKWFSFDRKWGGKIINLWFRHYLICLDFRKNWLADLIEGSK